MCKAGKASFGRCEGPCEDPASVTRALLGSQPQRGTKGPPRLAASRCISGRAGPHGRCPRHPRVGSLRTRMAKRGSAGLRESFLRFRGPGGRGGLCFPSGVAPRDCVCRVTRRPSPKMPSRSPKLRSPPRPGSARRREALPRRRFARAPQGALAAGQGRAGRGGAGRGVHVVRTVLLSGQVPGASALVRADREGARYSPAPRGGRRPEQASEEKGSVRRQSFPRGLWEGAVGKSGATARRDTGTGLLRTSSSGAEARSRAPPPAPLRSSPG